MVTMSCDTVLSKSRKTLFLCYKLQERLPANSHVRYELYNLAKHLKVNITSITAANFFEINKNCLIGIFGTVTTYFIVILQFSGNLQRQ
jgi:hypothetical protein